MNVSRNSQSMLVLAGALAVACGCTESSNSGNPASAAQGGAVPAPTGGATAQPSQGGTAVTSPAMGGSALGQGGSQQTTVTGGRGGATSNPSVGGTTSGLGGASSGLGGASNSSGGTTTATTGACVANAGCSQVGSTCKTASGQSCICAAASSSWSCSGTAAGGTTGQGGRTGAGGTSTVNCVSGANCSPSGSQCTTSAGVACICHASSGTWSCATPAAGGSAAGGAVSTLGGAPAVACSGTTKQNQTSEKGAKITLGKYFVTNNLWNDSTGNGTQSVWSTCNNGYAIGWGTSFNWGGANNTVKSYASAVLGWHWGWTVPIGNTELPVAVGGKSISCDWRYKVTPNGTVTMNVAYDIWIHSVALTGASNEWDTTNNPQFQPTDEIMIWLYRSNGAGPISSSGSPVGSPSVAGTTWDLYSGAVKDSSGKLLWNVYSYVRQVSSGDGAVFDIQDFMKDLVTRKYLTTSKHVSSVQAGTEIFIGQGQVDVSSFSCDVI